MGLLYLSIYIYIYIYVQEWRGRLGTTVGDYQSKLLHMVLEKITVYYVHLFLKVSNQAYIGETRKFFFSGQFKMIFIRLLLLLLFSA